MLGSLLHSRRVLGAKLGCEDSYSTTPWNCYGGDDTVARKIWGGCLWAAPEELLLSLPMADTRCLFSSSLQASCKYVFLVPRAPYSHSWVSQKCKKHRRAVEIVLRESRAYLREPHTFMFLSGFHPKDKSVPFLWREAMEVLLPCFSLLGLVCK